MRHQTLPGRPTVQAKPRPMHIILHARQGVLANTPPPASWEVTHHKRCGLEIIELGKCSNENSHKKIVKHPDTAYPVRHKYTGYTLHVLAYAACPDPQVTQPQWRLPDPKKVSRFPPPAPYHKSRPCSASQAASPSIPRGTKCQDMLGRLAAHMATQRLRHEGQPAWYRACPVRYL